jgi:hypothetical protein
MMLKVLVAVALMASATAASGDGGSGDTKTTVKSRDDKVPPHPSSQPWNFAVVWVWLFVEKVYSAS